MADWVVELRDRVGGFLADVTVPFKVRRGLDEAAHVSFTLGHEDDAAYALLDELTRGIPQIACYRDGVLWARGWWHPMEETAQDDTQMACVFRGPFARLESVWRTRPYSATGTARGNDPRTDDQGQHVLYQINPFVLPDLGLAVGTLYTSVTRDRFYPVGKNVAELIMQLTEVINGVEFSENPLLSGSDLAQLAVAGQGVFGQDRSATVIFEHNVGASNVLKVSRQLGMPVNHVLVIGGEYIITTGLEQGTFRRSVTVTDDASIATYGRQRAVLDLPDVTRTGTLTEHGQGALRPSPPQAISFQPDASGDLQPKVHYWLGDRVRLVADRDALQIDATLRVRAVEVAVDEDGNETHTVEVGDQRARPLVDTLRRISRKSAATSRHEVVSG